MLFLTAALLITQQPDSTLAREFEAVLKASPIEAFEFSSVEEVVVGSLEAGGQAQCLVALTSQDVTIYRISSIASSGRLSATSAVHAREGDVTGLRREADGRVVLTTATGARSIRAP